MNELMYRDAEIKDLERIVDIYNSTIASRLVTADTEPVSVEDRLPWFHSHNSDKRPLWVIENEENEIIGWVSLQSFYGRPAYDGTVEISIYMDENQRGKGLGKQILTDCIEKSKALGVKTLLGFIFAHNVPSIKLFQRLGFEEWALFPNIAEMDEKEFSLKILGKRIQ
ncbi:GNAT family N-acetyltransferase [Faecalibacter rhinopitheci]|uniref:N-acetyltransferase n=1 Tax=Faecalibacter rhinopitheci TaxID=2779678 RepID=A0A8J7K3K7_9FLAO|nr:GNAT family N-acetyltransferase [Faecalibacter rhinopitheci]MBF0596299.1 N-acetyltransferase [Faecalibacter rhinopitheci]